MRRNDECPALARLAADARCSSLESQATNWPLSLSDNSASSGGGISPLLSTACTSSHQSTSAPLRKSESNVSIRMLPSTVSGPWHSKQACLRIGRMTFVNVSGSDCGTSVSAAADAPPKYFDRTAPSVFSSSSVRLTEPESCAFTCPTADPPIAKSIPNSHTVHRTFILPICFCIRCYQAHWLYWATRFVGHQVHSSLSGSSDSPRHTRPHCMSF